MEEGSGGWADKSLQYRWCADTVVDDPGWQYDADVDDTADIAAGIYILQVVTKGGAYSQKVVVE